VIDDASSPIPLPTWRERLLNPLWRSLLGLVGGLEVVDLFASIGVVETEKTKGFSVRETAFDRYLLAAG
jgi:hypothetical protein